MSSNTNTDIWIAGAFAAFTVDVLVYPLDTLKTRIQSPDYKKLFLNHGTDTVNRRALFRGLYQGITSVVLATLPSSGAFFTTYEAVKHLGHTHNTNGFFPTPVIHSLASGTAELVSCAILTPAEVIKQNAQMVSQDAAANSNATIQTLKRFRSNPLGLWRGYSALAGRNLPFTAMQFPIFEKFKEYITEWRRQRVGHHRRPADISLTERGLVTASAAGTAGAIAAVITTPIDVVKTRIMLAAATGSENQDVKNIGKQAADNLKEGKVADAMGSITGGNDSKNKSQSSWGIGKEIVRDQGWKGLMRGGTLRGGWTMLGSGLYLGVYESGRLYLERGRINDQDD